MTDRLDNSHGHDSSDKVPAPTEDRRVDSDVRNLDIAPDPSGIPANQGGEK